MKAIKKLQEELKKDIIKNLDLVPLNKSEDFNILTSDLLELYFKACSFPSIEELKQAIEHELSCALTVNDSEIFSAELNLLNKYLRS
jgi:hypothetical protein